jgi:hypothetical protein
MKRRSCEYLDTIYTSNPDFDSLIKAVRQTVKTVNRRNREESAEPIQYFVRVRGRLGKNNLYAHLYHRGGPLYMFTSQDIKVEHSERVDVYIGTRSRYQ